MQRHLEGSGLWGLGFVDVGCGGGGGGGGGRGPIWGPRRPNLPERHASEMRVGALNKEFRGHSLSASAAVEDLGACVLLTPLLLNLSLPPALNMKHKSSSSCMLRAGKL